MKTLRKPIAILILAILLLMAIHHRFTRTVIQAPLSQHREAAAEGSPEPRADRSASPDMEGRLPTDPMNQAAEARRPSQLRRGPNHRLILEDAVELVRSTKSLAVFPLAVLQPRSGPPAGPLSMDEHTLSAIEAGQDRAALEQFLGSDAKSLRIPLAAGREVIADIDKVISRGPHTRTLLGKVRDDPFSDVLLVFHDGAISGSVAFYDTNTHFQFGMAGNGDIVIRLLDTDSYQAPCGDPGEETADVLDTGGDGSATGEEIAADPPAGSIVMDTVVGYDAQARSAAGGVAAMEALILASVDRMNAAIVNSQAGNGFVALMAMVEDPFYVFPGRVAGSMNGTDELGDLNTHGDGFLDTISQLRIDLGADHNVFVTKNADGSAGIAYRPGKSMIVARDYMTSTRITFAHEFGHSIGCRHSWGDSTSDNSTTVNNFGWRLDPPGAASRVRTIMAYDYGWGNRFPYYSNPDVLYNGAKTGAVNGYDATGDTTADQRYVSGGYEGSLGAGFDGTNPNLGANNAAYIVTYASTVNDNAARKSLAVLDPTAAVNWQKGQPQTIYWIGGDHTDTATIALYKGGVFQSTIASGISAEDRWLPWTPPAGLAAGTDYKIRVTLNGSVFDDSSAFTIGSPPSVTIDSPAATVAGLSSTSQSLNLEATISSSSGVGAVVLAWTKVSGPGTVTFGNPSAEDTTASFGATGIYQIRLTATQSGLVATAEVTVHVATPVSTTGLALDYRLDQTGGSTSVDSSGNGNNAAITGSPSWISGQNGNAMLLTQSPTYLSSGSGVAISDAGGFTAAAWVRLDTAATNNRHIIRQNTGGGTGRSWLYVGADGLLSSFVGNTTTKGTTLPLGEWHHVALTGGGGSIRIYLDGILVATNSASVETCSGIIVLGQTNSPSSIYQWLGAIDEARVYQRVLTADEISALMVTNFAPVVDAGPDDSALAGIPTNLAGSVSDDGSPTDPGTLTRLWSQVSGPAAAAITSPSIPTTEITFPTAGIYVFRLTGGDGDTVSTDEVTWTVSSPSPAEQWRFTHFGITANTGDAADGFDYDNDGVVNLLERAAGTIPTDAASHALPTVGLVDALGQPGDEYLSFSYNRISGGTTPGGNDYTAQGMVYTLEHSPDLDTLWDSSGFTELSVTPPVNGVETATFRLDAPVSGSPAHFLHLRVTSD